MRRMTTSARRVPNRFREQIYSTDSTNHLKIIHDDFVYLLLIPTLYLLLCDILFYVDLVL